MLICLHLILLISFVFPTLIAMDPPMRPPVQRTYPLDFQPMGFADDEDDSLIIEPNPISIETDMSIFEGIDVTDLEIMLDAAPKKAKWIIKDLTNKDTPDDCFSNAAFFIGNYGTGKTVLAKAIAYKVCSTSYWSYVYISSREFMGEYRNQTGSCLRSYLEKIVALKQPTLLIIDQLNKILEYTQCSSDDTAFASSVICNFLDNQKYNKSIFLLGIMDRATELDKRLKSRIISRCIKIEEPADVDLKRIIFISKLVNGCTKLHPEVTREWLTQFLKNTPALEGRNFRCLALHMKEMLKAQKTGKQKQGDILIAPSDLQLALENYLAANKHLNHIDPYENYVDLIERLHIMHLRQIMLDNMQWQNQIASLYNAEIQRQNRYIEEVQVNRQEEHQDDCNGCIIC